MANITRLAIACVTLLVVTFASFSFSNTFAAQAANDLKRVALVIGNGDYEHSLKLPNPPNDALAMKQLLSGMGFEVYSGANLNKQATERLLRDFAKAAKSADVSLLFYAGHGIQVNGVNYLIPVEAKVEDELALDFELISLDTITSSIGGGDKVGIVLLDACRDNPFTRSLSRSMTATRSATVQKGLAAPVSQSGGLLIGFAAAPGDVALDGENAPNSPFTTALLKHLPTPDVEIEQLLKRVKGEVAVITKNRQRPWHNSDLSKEIFLKSSKPTKELGGLVGWIRKDNKKAVTVPAPIASATKEPALESIYDADGDELVELSEDAAAATAAETRNAAKAKKPTPVVEEPAFVEAQPEEVLPKKDRGALAALAGTAAVEEQATKRPTPVAAPMFAAPKPLLKPKTVLVAAAKSADQLTELREVSVASTIAEIKKAELAVGLSRSSKPISRILQDADVPILPEREQSGNWAYPEVTHNQLPYSDSDTSVLDAEIEAVASGRENITNISKTAPPKPFDETFKLTEGSGLERELTDRGVSKAAAKELVKAIEPISPMNMIKWGTSFEVTFDRQIDFYGREVVFPIQLKFENLSGKLVVVTADEDGKFNVALSDTKMQ